METHEFFAMLIPRASGCQDWPGLKWTVGGYGRIGKLKAHRVAWEFINGTIPDGKMVLHTCDRPPCCRIDHLYLGTHADNMRDRDVRNRTRNGEAVNTAKLTEVQVREIRTLYACLKADGGGRRKAGEMSYSDIGQKYGVSNAMISFIMRGVSWKHIK